MSDHEVDALLFAFVAVVICASVVAVLAPRALTAALDPLVQMLTKLIGALEKILGHFGGGDGDKP